MNRVPNIYKIIAVFTALCVECTSLSIPLARAEVIPPSAPSIKKLNPELLKLPTKFGEVVESHAGKGNVVIIQDAHAIPDAQRNIANIIKFLQQEYGVDTVALEGASGDLDPQIFRSFPDKKLLRQVMKGYMDAGEIAGGTAAAVFDETPTKYQGVEDWDIYEEGLGLYLSAMEKEAALSDQLSAIREQLNKEKQNAYSKELLAVDRQVEKFYENAAQLTDLIKVLGAAQIPQAESELEALWKEVEKTNPSTSSGQAERPFDKLRASKPESKDVEVRELARKVEKVLSSQRGQTPMQVRERGLTPLAVFNSKKQEWMTGEISAEAFALYLNETSQKVGLSLEMSADLSGMVKDQHTLKGIEGTKLFKELETYIREVKRNLINKPSEVESTAYNVPRTPLTRPLPVQGEENAVRGTNYSVLSELNERTESLRLITKLAKLELPREEWKLLSSGLVFKTLEQLGLKQDDLVFHLAFYLNAEERDQIFFKGLEKTLKASNAYRVTSDESGKRGTRYDVPGTNENRTAIIVAGGFHAEGITSRLKEAGMGYALVMPKINHIPESLNYRSQMRGEVSWKDYFEVENGRIHLYKAFVRATRDKLLRGGQSSGLSSVPNDAVPDVQILKAWRDQIIRDLSDQGKVQRAAFYTRYMDEVVDDTLKHTDADKLMGKVDNFIRGLRGLEKTNQLTSDQIATLLKANMHPGAATGIPAATTPAASVKAEMLQLSPRGFPANKDQAMKAVYADLGQRSEARDIQGEIKVSYDAANASVSIKEFEMHNADFEKLVEEAITLAIQQGQLVNAENITEAKADLAAHKATLLQASNAKVADAMEAALMAEVASSPTQAAAEKMQGNMEASLKAARATDSLPEFYKHRVDFDSYVTSAQNQGIPVDGLKEVNDELDRKRAELLSQGKPESISEEDWLGEVRWTLEFTMSAASFPDWIVRRAQYEKVKAAAQKKDSSIEIFKDNETKMASKQMEFEVKRALDQLKEFTSDALNAETAEEFNRKVTSFNSVIESALTNKVMSRISEEEHRVVQSLVTQLNNQRETKFATQIEVTQAMSLAEATKFALMQSQKNMQMSFNLADGAKSMDEFNLAKANFDEDERSFDQFATYGEERHGLKVERDGFEEVKQSLELKKQELEASLLEAAPAVAPFAVVAEDSVSEEVSEIKPELVERARASIERSLRRFNENVSEVQIGKTTLQNSGYETMQLKNSKFNVMDDVYLKVENNIYVARVTESTIYFFRKANQDEIEYFNLEKQAAKLASNQELELEAVDAAEMPAAPTDTLAESQTVGALVETTAEQTSEPETAKVTPFKTSLPNWLKRAAALIPFLTLVSSSSVVSTATVAGTTTAATVAPSVSAIPVAASAVSSAGAVALSTAWAGVTGAAEVLWTTQAVPMIQGLIAKGSTLATNAWAAVIAHPLLVASVVTSLIGALVGFTVLIASWIDTRNNQDKWNTERKAVEKKFAWQIAFWVGATVTLAGMWAVGVISLGIGGALFGIAGFAGIVTGYRYDKAVADARSRKTLTNEQYNQLPRQAQRRFKPVSKARSEARVSDIRKMAAVIVEAISLSDEKRSKINSDYEGKFTSQWLSGAIEVEGITEQEDINTLIQTVLRTAAFTGSEDEGYQLVNPSANAVDSVESIMTEIQALEASGAEGDIKQEFDTWLSDLKKMVGIKALNNRPAGERTERPVLNIPGLIWMDDIDLNDSRVVEYLYRDFRELRAVADDMSLDQGKPVSVAQARQLLSDRMQEILDNVRRLDGPGLFDEKQGEDEGRYYIHRTQHQNGFRGYANDASILFKDRDDPVRVRTLRLNDLSVQRAALGVYSKGAPGDRVFESSGALWAAMSGQDEVNQKHWDQSYPTSPLNFYHWHVKGKPPLYSSEKGGALDLKQVKGEIPVDISDGANDVSIEQWTETLRLTEGETPIWINNPAAENIFSDQDNLVVLGDSDPARFPSGEGLLEVLGKMKVAGVEMLVLHNPSANSDEIQQAAAKIDLAVMVVAEGGNVEEALESEVVTSKRSVLVTDYTTAKEMKNKNNSVRLVGMIGQRQQTANGKHMVALSAAAQIVAAKNTHVGLIDLKGTGLNLPTARVLYFSERETVVTRAGDSAPTTRALVVANQSTHIASKDYGQSVRQSYDEAQFGTMGVASDFNEMALADFTREYGTENGLSLSQAAGLALKLFVFFNQKKLHSFGKIKEISFDAVTGRFQIKVGEELEEIDISALNEIVKLDDFFAKGMSSAGVALDASSLAAAQIKVAFLKMVVANFSGKHLQFSRDGIGIYRDEGAQRELILHVRLKDFKLNPEESDLLEKAEKLHLYSELLYTAADPLLSTKHESTEEDVRVYGEIFGNRGRLAYSFTAAHSLLDRIRLTLVRVRMGGQPAEPDYIGSYHLELSEHLDEMSTVRRKIEQARSSKDEGVAQAVKNVLAEEFSGQHWAFRNHGFSDSKQLFGESGGLVNLEEEIATIEIPGLLKLEGGSAVDGASRAELVLSQFSPATQARFALEKYDEYFQYSNLGDKHREETLKWISSFGDQLTAEQVGNLFQVAKADYWNQQRSLDDGQNNYLQRRTFNETQQHLYGLALAQKPNDILALIPGGVYGVWHMGEPDHFRSSLTRFELGEAMIGFLKANDFAGVQAAAENIIKKLESSLQRVAKSERNKILNKIEALKTLIGQLEPESNLDEFQLKLFEAYLPPEYQMWNLGREEYDAAVGGLVRGDRFLFEVIGRWIEANPNLQSVRGERHAAQGRAVASQLTSMLGANISPAFAAMNPQDIAKTVQSLLSGNGEVSDSAFSDLGNTLEQVVEKAESIGRATMTREMFDRGMLLFQKDSNQQVNLVQVFLPAAVHDAALPYLDESLRQLVTRVESEANTDLSSILPKETALYGYAANQVKMPGWQAAIEKHVLEHSLSGEIALHSISLQLSIQGDRAELRDGIARSEQRLKIIQSHPMWDSGPVANQQQEHGGNSFWSYLRSMAAFFQQELVGRDQTSTDIVIPLLNRESDPARVMFRVFEDGEAGLSSSFTPAAMLGDTIYLFLQRSLAPTVLYDLFGEQDRITTDKIIDADIAIAQDLRKKLIDAGYSNVVVAFPTHFGSETDAREFGLHSSTWNMIELMQTNRHLYRDKIVLDVGSGSGVLSATALENGASGVIMIERDPTANRMTQLAFEAMGYVRALQPQDLKIKDGKKRFYLSEGDFNQEQLKEIFKSVLVETIVQNWGNLTTGYMQQPSESFGDLDVFKSVFAAAKEVGAHLPSSIINGGYAAQNVTSGIPLEAVEQNLPLELPEIDETDLFGEIIDWLKAQGFTVAPSVKTTIEGDGGQTFNASVVGAVVAVSGAGVDSETSSPNNIRSEARNMGRRDFISKLFGAAAAVALVPTQAFTQGPLFSEAFESTKLTRENEPILNEALNLLKELDRALYNIVNNPKITFYAVEDLGAPAMADSKNKWIFIDSDHLNKIRSSKDKELAIKLLTAVIAHEGFHLRHNSFEDILKEETQVRLAIQSIFEKLFGKRSSAALNNAFEVSQVNVARNIMRDQGQYAFIPQFITGNIPILNVPEKMKPEVLYELMRSSVAVIKNVTGRDSVVSVVSASENFLPNHPGEELQLQLWIKSEEGQSNYAEALFDENGGFLGLKIGILRDGKFDPSPSVVGKEQWIEISGRRSEARSTGSGQAGELSIYQDAFSGAGSSESTIESTRSILNSDQGRKLLARAATIGREERPEIFPPGVVPHLESHRALIETLIRSGRLSPNFENVALTFSELHDLGYSLDVGDLANREKLIALYQVIGKLTGLNDENAADQAKKTVDFLAANKDNYMIAKVIAHGSTSIILAKERLLEAGFSEDQALGLALLFAAHHPGYPITLVDQFVIPGAIPAELRPLLIITSNNESGERGDPDLLRRQIAEYAADLLEITIDEALLIAGLGYALDRITPARRFEEFDINDFKVEPDGKVSGQPVFQGGETNKKYPLIVTNVSYQSHQRLFTVEEVYRLAIENLRNEGFAAIQTLEQFQKIASDDGQSNLRQLADVARNQSESEVSKTAEIQSKAIEFGKKVKGYTGNLFNLDQDIRTISNELKKIDVNNPSYDAATYLLGTLVSIKLSPLAQSHLDKARISSALMDWAKNLGETTESLTTALEVDGQLKKMSLKEFVGTFLLNQIKVKRYKAGQDLIVRDEKSDSLFILTDIDARVSVIVDGEPLEILAPIMHVGDVAALGLQEKRNATVRAVNDQSVLVLDNSAVVKLISAFPNLGVKLQEIARTRTNSKDASVRRRERSTAEQAAPAPTAVEARAPEAASKTVVRSEARVRLSEIIEQSQFPYFVLSDLLQVGPQKPIGYLPTATIGSPELQEKIKNWAEQNGLRTYLLQQGEFGFFYVYDPVSLQTLLDKNKDIIPNFDLQTKDGFTADSADRFVEAISSRTFHQESYPEFYKLIGIAFSDPRFSEDPRYLGSPIDLGSIPNLDLGISDLSEDTVANANEKWGKAITALNNAGQAADAAITNMRAEPTSTNRAALELAINELFHQRQMYLVTALVLGHVMDKASESGAIHKQRLSGLIMDLDGSAISLRRLLEGYEYERSQPQSDYFLDQLQLLGVGFKPTQVERDTFAEGILEKYGSAGRDYSDGLLTLSIPDEIGKHFNGHGMWHQPLDSSQGYGRAGAIRRLVGLLEKGINRENNRDAIHEMPLAVEGGAGNGFGATSPLDSSNGITILGPANKADVSAKNITINAGGVKYVLLDNSYAVVIKDLQTKFPSVRFILQGEHGQPGNAVEVLDEILRAELPGYTSPRSEARELVDLPIVVDSKIINVKTSLVIPEGERKNFAGELNDKDVLSVGEDGKTVVRPESWKFTGTLLDVVDEAFGPISISDDLELIAGEPEGNKYFSDYVLERARNVPDGETIAILGWGDGDMTTIIGLAEKLDKEGLRDRVKLIAFGNMVFKSKLVEADENGIEVIWDDATNLKNHFTDRKIDIVYSHFGISHLQNVPLENGKTLYDEHLGELHGMLNPGGTIVHNQNSKRNYKDGNLVSAPEGYEGTALRERSPKESEQGLLSGKWTLREAFRRAVVLKKTTTRSETHKLSSDVLKEAQMNIENILDFFERAVLLNPTEVANETTTIIVELEVNIDTYDRLMREALEQRILKASGSQDLTEALNLINGRLSLFTQKVGSKLVNGAGNQKVKLGFVLPGKKDQIDGEVERFVKELKALLAETGVDSVESIAVNRDAALGRDVRSELGVGVSSLESESATSDGKIATLILAVQAQVFENLLGIEIDESSLDDGDTIYRDMARALAMRIAYFGAQYLAANKNPNDDEMLKYIHDALREAQLDTVIVSLKNGRLNIVASALKEVVQTLQAQQAAAIAA